MYVNVLKVDMKRTNIVIDDLLKEPQSHNTQISHKKKG